MGTKFDGEWGIMNQVIQWWSMGGYSAYVWPAYSLAVIVLVGQAFGIRLQRARTMKRLQQWFKRQLS
ncbi:heme exporter protein CcmD [Legionella hackeliae]|uniref:Heme exporter protein D n=2 Tax=Legionella hackeliae TaxID=449 RepID=A0A0A8UN90_LEGHA|nr:heme exporter protein CcmD [Legionella hackeliae]CEK10345.1 CcmD [Legionella hackeliae]STX47076.1 heme exporter protein CcmD [Legionella hackeliae]